jgi:hypothetical protein
MWATLALVLFVSSVHVSVDQDGGLSGDQVRLVIGQIQRIWEDAGVEVTSGRYGDAPRPGQALVSLRILRILPPPGRTRVEPPLAWVALDEGGQLTPHLFVSLPAITSIVSVSEFAGYPIRGLAPQMRDELIARAIGRAAAHELGHYLLQRAGHQTEGLMRPTYALRDLVGDWLQPFKVSANDQLAVRTEIAAIARTQAAF